MTDDDGPLTVAGHTDLYEGMTVGEHAEFHAGKTVGELATWEAEHAPATDNHADDDYTEENH